MTRRRIIIALVLLALLVVGVVVWRMNAPAAAPTPGAAPAMGTPTARVIPLPRPGAPRTPRTPARGTSGVTAETMASGRVRNV